jgi:hypothetical protein
MRLVKILGVALVAVFAFSAMAATGASAHAFTNSAGGLLLLASADGPQLFTTPAGHLVCNTLKGDGTTAASSLTQLVQVLYEGCTVTGLLNQTVKPDEPIEAHYTFNADGTVVIALDITILALGSFPCTILVLPSGALSTVKYDNVGTSEVLVLAHVQGIESHATGSGCKATGTSNTGLYRGNAFVKVDGGTIQWS